MKMLTSTGSALLRPADFRVQAREVLFGGDSATFSADFFDGVAVVAKDLKTFDEATGLDDFVNRGASDAVVAAGDFQGLAMNAPIVIDVVEAQAINVGVKTAPDALWLTSGVHFKGGVFDSESVLSLSLIERLAVAFSPISGKFCSLCLGFRFREIASSIFFSLLFGCHRSSFPEHCSR